MAAGLDDLERWMCDLIRHGLGQLSGTPAWQEEAAARMVDAQLPGIAARLRNLQGVTSSGEDWPGVVLAQFGQLQLLIDAFRHLDALSPEEQADVRAALGLSPDKTSARHRGTPERSRLFGGAMPKKTGSGGGASGCAGRTAGARPCCWISRTAASISNRASSSAALRI
ncbi:MAG: hypothetical protein ACLU4B_02840 [Bilophila wadsworthia]